MKTSYGGFELGWIAVVAAAAVGSKLREASVHHWLCPGKHLMNKEKTAVVGTSNVFDTVDRDIVRRRHG